MRSSFRTLMLGACAALFAGILAAAAANITLFSSSLGDVVFPFAPPTATAPGTIDNMTIGATVPRAGNFTQSNIVQGAPAAKTVSGTLAAADILTGIITVLQGGGAPSAQQLPLATAMDTAFPGSAAGFSFDFSYVNISANAAETATLTTNTGWTLVGGMDVAAIAAGTKSSGRLRARKTGAGAWTLYRLS